MHSKDALLVFIIWRQFLAEKKLFFYGRGLFGARYMKGVSEVDFPGMGHLH